MKLRPAIFHKGKLYVGEVSDHHANIAERHNIPAPDKNRGFTPDGKNFLSRQQAEAWMKRHEPEAYKRLTEIPNGLHSENYAKAHDVEQKPSPEEANGNREAGKDQRSSAPAAKVNLKEKSVIVYDRGGLYLYCAEKLAESFKTVYYYLADADAYPTSQKHTIGMGIKGVKRVHDFWKYIDKADMVAFFDCYDGELQSWLVSKGYKVFGSGNGEQIEIDKILFLETLEELNLPVPKTYLAEGMDDLKQYLEENKNETLWLKNLHRGDFETRKFTSMAQIKPFLDDLRKRLGTASDTMEVLVQHKIESAAEVGYDGYMLDGEFTTNCIVGYEVKDKGFVGKIFEETPEIVKGINDAFAPVFKKLGYHGNYSTEIRVTEKGEPYYIDATCRVPSPPGEVMCEVYENWAEAVWQLAHNELPELEPKAKFVAEIILTSGWYDQHELNVKFPKEIAQYVKLKNHTVRDGEYYCIPNGNGEFFGAVVAYADTQEEAIKLALERAEQVEADDLDYDDTIFDKAAESIKAGENFGIKF